MVTQRYKSGLGETRAVARLPPMSSRLTALPRSPHVLVVDDDREIRGLLAKFLGQHGIRVTQAADGQSMLKAFDAGRYDLIILDLMLPGEDGLALCRRIRQNSDVPIIMLTAMTAETDRIIGLELGADDYMVKPFNPRELLARAKAVLRRTHALPPDTGERRPRGYRFAGWRLDVPGRVLTSPDEALMTLSTGEFDLLLAFVEHPQRVLSREQLLDLARGRASVLFDRSMDVQVSRLRRKLEPDPQMPTLIKTVRGGGYLFTPDVGVAE